MRSHKAASPNGSARCLAADACRASALKFLIFSKEQPGDHRLYQEMILPVLISSPLLRFTRLVLLLSLCFFLGDRFRALAAPIRLAVVFQGEGNAPLQDLLTAALSKEPDMEILEREQLRLLVDEAALRGDVRQQTALGKWLALDQLLHVRALASDRWQIRLVHAQTGEQLTADTLNIPPGTDPVPELTAAAKRLLQQGHKQPDPASLRVSVLDFQPGASDAEANGLALHLSAQTRSFLSGGGMRVLDRALTEQIAQENGLRQQGLIPPAKLPLLGADLVVTGNLTGESGTTASLELCILQATNGAVAASGRFPLRAEEGNALPLEARQWLVQTLHPARTAERTPEENVQIEALEPFYQGIAQFLAGHYLEAIDAFQRAYTLDDQFSGAMLWEARCYDALGLQSLAKAARRFTEVALSDRGTSQNANAAPEEAITFLGVSAAGEPLAARTVEMLAINRLARTQRPVRLAESLTALRDEYDVLVGAKNREGSLWDQSFLSRWSMRGELSGIDATGTRRLEWLLVDTVSGNTVARDSLPLGREPAAWPAAIQGALEKILSAPSSETADQFPAPAPLPPVAELEGELAKYKGVEANRFLLQLLQADPGNPILRTRTLSKAGAGRSDRDVFFQFAVREEILSRLAPDHPMRPWLELEQLMQFQDFNPVGRFVTGTKPDAAEEIRKFASRHENDLPGCFAQYMFLWEHLGDWPPQQLADALAKLEPRLAGFADTEAGNLPLVRKMTTSLHTIALIATGAHPELSLPTPSQDFPFRLLVKFDGQGRPKAEIPTRYWYHYWRTSEWNSLKTSQTRQPEEARAGLAIMGRYGDLLRVEPRWLREFPHATVMTTFAISTLFWLNYPRGHLFLEPSQPGAARKQHHATARYCIDNLLQELKTAESPREVETIECLVDELMNNLALPGFAPGFETAEWEEARQKLLAAFDAADARLGATHKPVKFWRSPSPWRITPSPGKDDADNPELQSKRQSDREAVLKEEQTLAENSWAEGPLTNRKWLSFVQNHRFAAALTPQKEAEIWARYLSKLSEFFPEGKPLEAAEASFFYDFARTLVEGEQLTASDPLFERVAEAPLTEKNGLELRANAALNLAWNLRAENRKAEALRHARQALELLGGNPTARTLNRFSKWDSAGVGKTEADFVSECNLRAIAVRLIRTLRAEELPLPAGVRRVVVRTPSFENAEVPFYYRIPEGSTPSGGRQVLIVCPGQNQSALDACRESSEWARYAQKRGLVLCVPQFLPEFRRRDGPGTTQTAVRAISPFEYASQWSGKALLDALELIRQESPITTNRLLLHGFGTGGLFVQEFAVWKPQRCGGLSFHSAPYWQYWLWEDRARGLRPLASLRKVPCFVSAGAEDDFGCSTYNRWVLALQWAELLRDEGVSVLWKSWPGIGHYPAPGLQKASESFFDSILSPNP